MPRINSLFRFLVISAIAFVVSWWMPIAPTDPLHQRKHDVLMALNPPVPVSPEILIVEFNAETVPDLRSETVQAEALLFLTKMGADKALFLIPAGDDLDKIRISAERERTIKRRFNREFSLVDGNIEALFEAILRGTIRPGESEEFVGELRRLVAESEERLLADVLSGDETGRKLLEQAQSVFGADRVGYDLGDFDISLPAQRDTWAGVTSLCIAPQPIEGTLPFRRLDVATVLDYFDTERAVRAQLAEMESAGYFGGVDPEKRPAFLAEYVLSRRREMLDNPQSWSVSKWLEAGDAYENGIDALLNGSTEGDLLGTLQSQRAELEGVLRGSFVIIAPKPDPARLPEDIWLDPSEGETAAARINGVLTGAHVLVPTGEPLRLLAFLAAVAVAGVLSLLTPIAAVAGTLVAAAAVLAGVVVLFLRTGIWIDPIYLAVAFGVTAAAAILVGAVFRVRVAGRLQGNPAYRFPKRLLNSLLTRGFRTADIEGKYRAAVVAVRYVGQPLVPDDFLETVSREIVDLNGVILGADGPVVIAAFGTPIDGLKRFRNRSFARTGSVERACAAVLQMVESYAPNTRHCGIDVGEITFSVTKTGGYGATGRAIGYAQRLSELTMKYGCRALVSHGVVEEAEKRWTVKKRGLIVDSVLEKKSPFFELIVPQPK